MTWDDEKEERWTHARQHARDLVLAAVSREPDPKSENQTETEDRAREDIAEWQRLQQREAAALDALRKGIASGPKTDADWARIAKTAAALLRERPKFLERAEWLERRTQNLMEEYYGTPEEQRRGPN